MYDSKTKRCDDRIVSIHQPHVRPIIRGKLNKPVEFGAKLGASLNGDGLAFIDPLSWDAYHEGSDLEAPVEAYYQRYGYYPEKVLADPLYGTQSNRRYLKKKQIHLAAKPLGDDLQRIPVEGKFGQGKNGYGLRYIRAKRADTSSAWMHGIFLVMNLLILLKIFSVCYSLEACHRVGLLLHGAKWHKHPGLSMWVGSSSCGFSTY